VLTSLIRADRFSGEVYLEYFPNGNHAAEFRADAPLALALPQPVTVHEYFATWIARKTPPVVRPGQARDYRQHMTGRILPAVIAVSGTERAFGDLPKEGLTAEHILPCNRPCCAPFRSRPR
jgi:hypothetical protein